MKYLQSYKLFEKIYIGKIGLSDYNFIFDQPTNTGWLNLYSDDLRYNIEIKLHKEDELMIFSPTEFPEYNFEKIIDDIIYLFNKNRLGYKFNKKNIVYQKYGLKPYGIIGINRNVLLSEIEKIVHSTKTINSKVKKNGDIDQFTY